MAEKEYIERDSIYHRVKRHTNPYGKPTLDYESGVKVLDMIKQEPAADVVEVRHGEWIIKINYKTPVSHAHIRKEKLYICPYCGKDYRQHMNFCGNCGVKMDGATDNNVGGKREG